MGLTLTYPTNHELDMVVQEYIAQTANYRGAEILPEVESMSQKVRWDEKDTDRGMTAPHVMGTDPKIDKRPGSKTREFEPIPFKESDVMKESEILRARELGTLNGTINLTRAVGEMVSSRMDKTKTRVEWLRWQAIFGEIHVNENGVKVDEVFPVQNYDVVNDWSDLLNASPLKDLNRIKLMFRGTGASAQGAKVWINQTTANWLLENQNENDLKGFQNSNFLNLAFSIEEVNKILTARGLPTIEVYDEFYIDEDGNTQLFIPDAKIAVVGARAGGQKPGDICLTPTLHRQKDGQPAPGYFSLLEVNGKPTTGSTNVSLAELGAGSNPSFKTTGGVYCGPRMIFPRSIIKSQVSS
jgi:Phage major capsid protein E